MMKFFFVGRLEHTGDDPVEKRVFDHRAKPEDPFLSGAQRRGDKHEPVREGGVVHGNTTGDRGAIGGAHDNDGVMGMMEAVENGSDDGCLCLDVGERFSQS